MLEVLVTIRQKKKGHTHTHIKEIQIKRKHKTVMLFVGDMILSIYTENPARLHKNCYSVSELLFKIEFSE